MPRFAKQVSAKQIIVPCMSEIIFALQKLITRNSSRLLGSQVQRRVHWLMAG